MLKQRLLLSLASFVNFLFLFLAHVFFVSRSEILELTLPLSEFRFFFVSRRSVLANRWAPAISIPFVAELSQRGKGAAHPSRGLGREFQGAELHCLPTESSLWEAVV